MEPRPLSLAEAARNATPFRPARIVSGGQTGVDRAALDVALELGISHGGYCPKGRRAEDGTIDGKYDLRETPSHRYPQRTEWNVRESDATLILHHGKISVGTELTRQIALRLQRSHLCVNVQQPDASSAIRDWLGTVRPAVLNIAGPRETSSPGIQDRAQELLLSALRPS